AWTCMERGRSDADEKARRTIRQRAMVALCGEGSSRKRTMKIASVARALPPHRFTQQEIFEALARHWQNHLDNPALLARFHQRVGVDTRYFVLPLEGYDSLTRWGDANRVWLEQAEELGEQAIDLALERAGMERSRINALLTVSVTGIASPSRSEERRVGKECRSR